LTSKKSITKEGGRSRTGAASPPNSDLVTFPAQPHALPFRTILGEYYARRRGDLAKVSAGIPEIQSLDPFNDHDKHFESIPGKFIQRQWTLLQKQIQISEDAYRFLAAKKEELAAVSEEDSRKLAADHRRIINELNQKKTGLEKDLASAQPASKQELAKKREALEQELDEEQARKKTDKVQRKIIDGYRKVLDAETECKKADHPLLQVLHGMNGSAVCLSGGGIRSASFCLGVLQGLARFSTKRAPKPDCVPAPGELGYSALERLDYLSTVSGGGYIGSWLMAWAFHAQYKNVVKLLAHPANTSADTEPQPIRHLREYTSYLTPHYGFTLDTMTVGAIVARNLILNWMILVPALVLLFCAPELFYQLSVFVPLSGPEWVSNYSVGIASALVCWATIFVARSTFKPSYASQTKDPQDVGRTSREIFNLILPLMAAAWILAEGWASASYHQPSLKDSTLFDIALHFAPFPTVPLMVMAVARVWWSWPNFDLKNPSPLRRQQPGDASDSQDSHPAAKGGDSATSDASYHWIKIVDWWNVLWALIAPFLIGVLTTLALAACAKYIPMPDWSLQPKTYQPRMFVWLCLPLIWSLLLLASTLLSGLLSGIESEEEREWWSRAGGLMIMVQLGWLALMGVAFYAGYVVTSVAAGILSAAGLASGYLGSLAGLSAATSSGLKKVKLDQLTTAQKWLAKHELLAPVACAIAIICISFALAGMTSGLRDRVYALTQNCPTTPAASTSTTSPEAVACRKAADDSAASHIPDTWTEQSAIGRAVRRVLLAINVDTSFLDAPPLRSKEDSSGAPNRLKKDFIANLVIALIAFLIAALANEFINVNTFSLHGMYRMRLTRAYLGASNFARHADNFTDFDGRDNLYEADVVYHDAPLHIINTALNVVATSNLAWQQRKAEPFTFSPLSVGGWRLGYLPTSLYGGSKGVKLGTAMSISGAAFNPNMGYHSSPMVTLLMTFFNARLGWWLPNPIWPLLEAQKSSGDSAAGAGPVTLESLLQSQPGAATYLRRESPIRALFTLIYEALGRTDDKFKWIELTDGGHFENLGLYEMVMRRCRYIIMVDSDADSDFEFEDLGNAVRKIEIDFGVPIRFPKYPKGLPMKRGIDESNVYFAVGDIRYDLVDGIPDSSGTAAQGIGKGTLLYIKPCLNGSEPLGVRAYANAYAKFPHESTANQFFNEAQFESYRNLGSWEFGSIVSEFSKDTLPPGSDIETLFDNVSKLTNAESVDTKGAGLWGIVKSALGWLAEEPSKSDAGPSSENASPVK
jgi:hypothetical protein